mgnify:CR=1 FL=1
MSEVFHYQQCIDAFMDSLAQLHGHIVEHDMHECAERDANEIATALGMLSVAMANEYTEEERATMGWRDGIYLKASTQIEHAERAVAWKTSEARWEREWNEAWDYLRDNLRKWWC